MYCEADMESNARTVVADAPKNVKKTRRGSRMDACGLQSLHGLNHQDGGRCMPTTMTKRGQQDATYGCKAGMQADTFGPLGHVCRRKERREKRCKA